MTPSNVANRILLTDFAQELRALHVDRAPGVDMDVTIGVQEQRRAAIE